MYGEEFEKYWPNLLYLFFLVECAEENWTKLSVYNKLCCSTLTGTQWQQYNLKTSILKFCYNLLLFMHFCVAAVCAGHCTIADIYCDGHVNCVSRFREID